MVLQCGLHPMAHVTRRWEVIARHSVRIGERVLFHPPVVVDHIGTFTSRAPSWLRKWHTRYSVLG